MGEKFEFSRDTIVFDTVFTTIGSTSRIFSVYNKENFTLKFDEIRLMGGENSPFRFNFNGTPGFLHQDITVEAGDSLFGFVDVTLQVNGQTLPMVIEDSILFRSGNTSKYLILAVWGQDIYYHFRDVSEGMWPNDKPHLVYSYTAVDSSKSLIIQAGTTVYFHNNARFIVYKGALDIQGQLDNNVVFRGDRLESFYAEVPGQWYGLQFIEAKASSIEYLNLKNAVLGVQIDSTGSGNDWTVDLRNSQFYNLSVFGIYAVAGARIRMENCVVNNSGVHSVYLFAGGAYNFNHCTLANLGSQIRNTPLFAIKDHFISAGITYVRPITEAIFNNCVIWGSQESELGLDILNTNTNYSFGNCLIKNNIILTSSSFLNCLWNQNPNFEAASNNNLNFVLPSPLNNNANSGTSNASDINGTPRTGPDIGAYEVP